MRTELLSQAYAALAQFASESRLYELSLEKDGDYGSPMAAPGRRIETNFIRAATTAVR
jgi:hypothetical protein